MTIVVITIIIIMSSSEPLEGTSATGGAAGTTKRLRQASETPGREDKGGASATREGDGVRLQSNLTNVKLDGRGATPEPQCQGMPANTNRPRGQRSRQARTAEYGAPGVSLAAREWGVATESNARETTRQHLPWGRVGGNGTCRHACAKLSARLTR